MRSQHRALQIDTFHSDAFVVQLRGELDLAGCLDVELALEDAERSGAERVYLDIEGLTFLDSCGLARLLAARRRARRAGHRLVLVRGPAAVQRLFALSAVDEAFEMVSDVELALTRT